MLTFKGTYDEELVAICHLGRLNPALSTSVLNNCFNSDTPLLMDPSTATDQVKERIYWLILISGFFLADDMSEEGDLFSVPELLNAYSTHCSQSRVIFTKDTY